MRDARLHLKTKKGKALNNIIQCHKMVKVSGIHKGFVRGAVKADQRFLKGITAGCF